METTRQGHLSLMTAVFVLFGTALWIQVLGWSADTPYRTIQIVGLSVLTAATSASLLVLWWRVWPQFAQRHGTLFVGLQYLAYAAAAFFAGNACFAAALANDGFRSRNDRWEYMAIGGVFEISAILFAAWVIKGIARSELYHLREYRRLRRA